MVNLHFLSLMEALLECRSTILAKLMPLWCPVLHAYNITVHRLSSDMQAVSYNILLLFKTMITILGEGAYY